MIQLRIFKYFAAIRVLLFLANNCPNSAVSKRAENSLANLHRIEIMPRDENIHVVLLPWSAFGHIMPFFQLSIALARAGVRVSLVSTPKNIQRLAELPPDLEGSVDLVGLPLPAIDRNLLPEGAEATIDIPFHKIQYLKIAYDLLKNPFKQFIADQVKPPDWIVADLLTYWAAEVGQEFNIPIICFYPFSAATTVFFGPPEYLAGEGRKRVRPTPESLMRKPEWVDFPSTVAYRKREAISVHAGFYHENAAGISTGQRIAKVVEACKAVAIRSCPEFERDYFNLQQQITGKPAIPLGFLPPETSNNLRDESWDNIFRWLDEQKPIKSVVFVGFGSECKLRKDQIHEIAYGLEVSGLPFVWVLQKPSWGNSDNDASEVDVLPLGFISRVRGKGIILIGWQPQREILAHPAVGGCLFHAGWGSVIETLQHGHSLVVLPFLVDQGLNSRYLVEKGLAIEVERSEDGSFSTDDIAQSLRRAMVPNVEDEGEALRLLRARAAVAAALFGDRKLNDYYIERFVEFLKNTNWVQN